MRGYTVGYGGRQPQAFVTLLQQQHLATVVDVRLRPDRASMGSYARARSADKGIQGLLAGGGMAYVSLPELGNLFLECDDWPQRYARLFAATGDLLIERLLSIPAPWCLLCAERQVTSCHRQYIAAYLEQQGWEMIHLA